MRLLHICKDSSSICAKTIKGLYFKKLNGGLYNDLERTNYKLYFFAILKKILSAYMENTHNGEKRKEAGHISVKIGST